MMGEMRDSRSAAQISHRSHAQLIHFSFLIFFIFSFRQYPSLHDIALLRTACITSLTVTLFGLHRHVESLAAAASPHTPHPNGKHYTLSTCQRPPAHCLVQLERQSIGAGRKHLPAFSSTRIQQLPTPLRSGNEPQWHGQVVDTFTFIHSSRTG
jgi:hypothetical protein